MSEIGLQRLPLLPCLAASLLTLLGSCSSSQPNTTNITNPDAGMADSIQPSDIDQFVSDTHGGNIGKACDPSNENNTGCIGDAVCLAIDERIGICALDGCTPEDLETPAVEDDCPKEPITTVCSSVPVRPDGAQEPELHNLCLPACVPDSTRNSCEEINPEVGCDPITVLTNGHTEVCLFPVCREDRQCGTGNALNPDMRCDVDTGLCFNLGSPDATIGAPCTIGKDCGKGQFCFPEQRTPDGATKVAGGYCTILGCKYKGLWTCPEDSKCFGMGSGEAVTLCLMTGCVPETEEGCRELAPEGQYDCIEFESEGVCWVDLTD